MLSEYLPAGIKTSSVFTFFHYVRKTDVEKTGRLVREGNRRIEN